MAMIVGLLVAAPAQAKTTTHTWRVGPVDMRGYATEQALEYTRAPRIDGYLTAMYARIVDAAGRPVPQERVMLHHVFFVNHGRFRGDRRAGDCRSRVGETFYGTGEEDQAIELPPGYGYRLRKRDRWRVGCVPSGKLAVPGVGRPRWRLILVRQRGGEPYEWIMEGPDAEGRLALPAEFEHRPDQARRAAA